MVQVEDLIDIAIKEEASDIHLIAGMKPLLRIIRELKEIDKYDVLTEDDMYEIYDSVYYPQYPPSDNSTGDIPLIGIPVIEPPTMDIPM